MFPYKSPKYFIKFKRRQKGCVLYKVLSVSPVRAGGDGTGGSCCDRRRHVEARRGWVVAHPGSSMGGGKPSAIAPTQEAARLAKLGHEMLLVGVKCLEASPVSDILV